SAPQGPYRRRLCGRSGCARRSRDGRAADQRIDAGRRYRRRRSSAGGGAEDIGVFRGRAPRGAQSGRGREADRPPDRISARPPAPLRAGPLAGPQGAGAGQVRRVGRGQPPLTSTSLTWPFGPEAAVAFGRGPYRSSLAGTGSTLAAPNAIARTLPRASSQPL